MCLGEVPRRKEFILCTRAADLVTRSRLGINEYLLKEAQQVKIRTLLTKVRSQDFGDQGQDFADQGQEWCLVQHTALI